MITGSVQLLTFEFWVFIGFWVSLSLKGYWVFEFWVFIGFGFWESWVFSNLHIGKLGFGFSPLVHIKNPAKDCKNSTFSYLDFQLNSDTLG